MKYNHTGVPTHTPQPNEKHLPHLKMFVTDHLDNPYRLQWMRFEADAPYPDIIKQKPHLAFIVENLQQSLTGKKVIIEPNSPSQGLIVAFIEENGIPIELMQIDSSASNVI